MFAFSAAGLSHSSRSSVHEGLQSIDQCSWGQDCDCIEARGYRGHLHGVVLEPPEESLRATAPHRLIVVCLESIVTHMMSERVAQISHILTGRIVAGPRIINDSNLLSTEAGAAAETIQHAMHL